MEQKRKLTIAAFVLMILTSVFGVTNIGIGFYRMGYAAIPMFVLGGLLYFIPYLFMMIELGTGFKDSEGGIYTWMRETVSSRFAFYGIFMWYSSYIIWMFGKALNIWTPLSVALLGKDVTANMNPMTLTFLGVILILGLTLLIFKGTSKFAKIASIGGISVIALNVILIFGGIIVFALNGFAFSEPLTMNALVQSPNADFTSPVAALGFVVFAVFAYGGTEAMAGIGDELENPERDLKRGILIAGAFIVLCYVIGFFMVGAIMPWNEFGENVNSLSALYMIMDNLGNAIGGPALGQFLMRFSGLGMFFSFFGAMITLMYAPLRQLIEATPKEFWPESFQKENEAGMLTGALKAQAIIVIIILLAKGLASMIDQAGASALFENIVTMTNVAMTLPYLFLIWSWYKFRTNDKFTPGLILIKGDFAIKFWLVMTFIMVLFGNVFTVISPFMAGDINTGIWTVAGPIFFVIIAAYIYNRKK